ncbi:hypothetical protein [Bosea sp. BIWAKO-01]|uniref:hypothetical protein n=1 Tax=Bosea sp. BIWAKO-01 TaxID=506668 RepID=UPI0008538820|nr:hypothetical protein [Bosea sp. BIWAKO-01]GAU80577.1 hypothetical protein BIWAKO_00465 [Bosea sp. BIWAKO-01]
MMRGAIVITDTLEWLAARQRMAEIEEARPGSPEADEWAELDYAAFCWEEDHMPPLIFELCPVPASSSRFQIPF